VATDNLKIVWTRITYYWAYRVL